MSPLKFPVFNFLPKSEYPPKNKGDIPLFLIAHGNKKELIIQQYQKFGRDPQHAGPYGFTALSVAVMAKYHEIVSYLLLNLRVPHDPKDHIGLTPLHYACALGDTKSMRLLQEAANVQVTLDMYQIFPGWKSVLEPRLPKADDVVIHRKLKSGRLVPMTAKQFQKIAGGAQFYDGVKSSREQFLKQLEKRLKEVKVKPQASFLTFLKRYAKEMYEKSGGAPSKLYLGLQGAAGMGVFAGEDLPEGAFICLYGSEIKVEGNNSDSDYRFEEFDGERVRNTGTMVNDGLPNVTFLPVEMPDGRTFPGLFALEPIKKDTPITFNYSIRHNVKLRVPHSEISSKKTEEYFAANPPSKILVALESVSKKLPDINEVKPLMEFYRSLRKLVYLFHTPTTLFTLYLQGVLKKEEVLFLKQNQTPLFIWIEASEFPQLRYMMQQFFELDEILSDSSQEALKLKEMLLKFYQKYSCVSISLLFSHLVHPMVKSCQSWKRELDIYPKLMGHLEYAHSLCFSRSISPDQKKLQEVEKTLGLLPLFKPFACRALINTVKGFASDRLPIFQAIFEASAKKRFESTPPSLDEMFALLSSVLPPFEK